MTTTSHKNPFTTPNGMPRIRWWPLLVAGYYLALNVATLASVVLGASGKADSFFHAPLIWLFA